MCSPKWFLSRFSLKARHTPQPKFSGTWYLKKSFQIMKWGIKINVLYFVKIFPNLYLLTTKTKCFKETEYFIYITTNPTSFHNNAITFTNSNSFISLKCLLSLTLVSNSRVWDNIHFRIILFLQSSNEPLTSPY